MGMIKKIFSIPEKFGRIFSFYNKHGIVSRITMLILGAGFTIGTLALENWAFGLFSKNYFLGIIALILSFSIGLGCTEFLIMCCITAVLSMLKSSVVDTARFISKKTKKNKGSKDEPLDEEFNSEGLAVLIAAEENEKKYSKDAEKGFKDAVEPTEWEKTISTLQNVNPANNNVLKSENLSSINQNEITIKVENDNIENTQNQSVNNFFQIQETEPDIDKNNFLINNNDNKNIEIQDNIVVQKNNLANNQIIETENLTIVEQPENINIQTKESQIIEEQPVQTESIVEIESVNEETKRTLDEDESKKIESMLQNEKELEEELKKKSKRSYKILDIFCVLMFSFLGFVVVTKYIAIFKANSYELKFWEKINFTKIWESIKFW